MAAQEASLTKMFFTVIAGNCRLLWRVYHRRLQWLDMANRFLDHGNYLAYGIAATAWFSLACPTVYLYAWRYTRRGYHWLFDVAQTDALILPQAFIAAMAKGASISPSDHTADKAASSRR